MPTSVQDTILYLTNKMISIFLQLFRLAAHSTQLWSYILLVDQWHHIRCNRLLAAKDFYF
jgi:hypothetical protein